MLGRVMGIATTAILVVAVLGLAIWFAYSTLTGATLVVFRTGSMSPAMPQGTLALTLPVGAHELQPGDIVTVQREAEKLPVTHRVLEIQMVDPEYPGLERILATAPDTQETPDPLSSDARMLTLQGDANATPDPLPYVATQVRRTVFSVPGLGTALTLLQTPIGLGALTIGLGALAIWAFWPARSPQAPDPPRYGVRRAHAQESEVTR